MATTKEFHDYILEQLQKAGDVTTRKMMGEYCVYFNGKLAMSVLSQLLPLLPNDMELLKLWQLLLSRTC